MERITFFNIDENKYEVAIPYNSNIYLRTESEEKHISPGIATSYAKHFISGFMIDKLALYENSGLTPDEVEELQGDILHNLKQSNETLRQNNDKYYVEYQKLLDENRKLKSLLKIYLDEEQL